MRIVARIGAIYVLALLAFLWGFSVSTLKIFPYQHLEPIKNDLVAFLVGNVDDKTSLGDKLLNDFGISPERSLRDYTPGDPSGFREIPVAGLNDRREAPRVRISPEAPPAYRLIVGAFDFEQAFWGALLLDPQGKVAHRWTFDGQIEGYSEEADVLKNLYGVGFFPDGSAVFTMQEKLKGLVKVDLCSDRQWIRPGKFHHTIQPTHDARAFWTFSGNQGQLHPVLTLVDAANGKTLREIDMADVERANPDLYIFDLRAVVFNDEDDSTHPNDIDPLPPEMAAAFPMFEAGDLVLSYRTTNLVMVIDPDTLKVKWYRIGATDGQHDPDWRPNGMITVFNNRHRAERRGTPPYYSNIVELDPATGRHRVVLDGRKYNFHSSFNGHHTYGPGGTIVITSSTQGRVFEVDPKTGKVVFEFVNAYSWAEGRTLHLSQTFVIDDVTARRWIAKGCGRTAENKG